MKHGAAFIEPMLLQQSDRLPDGQEWVRELKLDGYRAVAFKSAGKVHLRSRNDKDFNLRYPEVVRALARLPDETVIDGEIVALDESGRPSFNLLQNCGSSRTPIIYYIFDLMVLSGRDVMAESLDSRRTLLEQHVLPTMVEPIRYSQPLPGSVADLTRAIKAQGLEGLVAKRRGSRYESGARSGAWRKMRINRGQDFVIGGYTVGGNGFDALIFGYYEGETLLYVARTRNGFTATTRSDLMKILRPLETRECPFCNLPEAKSGRWGIGLTAAKMADCRWLKPLLVAQFEYVEWTPDNHLRHSTFIALRTDKRAPDVVREG